MIRIGKATIEIFEDSIPFAGKPMALPEDEQIGQLTKFRVTTTDTLDYLFGFINWPNAAPEVRFLEALDGEQKYEPLTHAGRLGVLTKFGDFWLVELRAMKYNPDAKKTNLATATIEKLNEFCSGDAIEYLRKHGATKIGSREVLVGDTGKTRGYLAMVCPTGNIEAIAVAFTLTRVLAIMMDYGQ